MTPSPGMKTYAQATETIVIKQKFTQVDIRNNLDPTLFKIGISQVKDSKDGSIVITCYSKEHIEKIKSGDEVEGKLCYNGPEKS